MQMKAVEERDFEIASLKNHIESRDAAESSYTHTVENVDKGKSTIKFDLDCIVICSAVARDDCKLHQNSIR
ncbi:hypothetical protein E5676_scaffold1737G001520 [Cucumis melo var. makuwa]|uniref:Uncharacterized protein n=1 Tax=Cucumis melo var. makuwa TaxID=1194695 RepID=A0A5A7UAR6_CUCMM|nr:hypothetical protein E6C27_scaffold673G00490 [Cucumis melo var. makuwa]TYK07851.1 hypothetical protein E5676_scaffold1737G001520 [Cucumis melo var. makuwa]